MDENETVTYFILGGYEEVKKYWAIFFVIILIIFLLTVVCNFMVLYVILVHRDLHEPMYIFIAALLINSLYLSLLVQPKLLIDFLYETPTVSHSLCHFQFYAYYHAPGVEYYLLAVMAYDRYVAITKPFQYSTIMTKKTVCVLLLLCWLWPCGQTMVVTIWSSKLRFCNVTLNGFFCTNTIFRVYCVRATGILLTGAIFSSYIILFPPIILISTYIKILLISYRSCKQVRSKALQTCLPHVIVLVNFNFLSIYDITVARLDTEVPKLQHVIMTLQFVLYNPLFNPIIYGLKMKKISKHLKKLFC